MFEPGHFCGTLVAADAGEVNEHLHEASSLTAPLQFGISAMPLATTCHRKGVTG
jgi:hypothetical protein